jgi:hippurate hydrolase
MKDRWKGTVLFIVQPAEERVGGAAAMLKDGLYTRFPKPNYALAFHVAAELPTGHIAAAEGIQYSSADSIDIKVNGIGTHGAAPQLGKDPIYIASQIVVALQGIISRERARLNPASSPSGPSTQEPSTTSSLIRQTFKSPSARTAGKHVTC